MAHPLDNCRAKIKRARELLEYLDDEIGTFLANSYAAVRHDDPETGQVQYRVKSIAQPDALARFAVLAGEIVHHLRSCFDYLAWQLVKANGNPDPGKVRPKVGFPIYKDKQKYGSEGARQVSAVDARAAVEIERLQPYHRGKSYASEPLWIIHHLDIIDKHKLLLVPVHAVEIERPDGVVWVLAFYSSEAAATFVPDQPIGVVPIERYRRFGAEDGAILFSLPAAYKDVTFRFRFEMVLGNIGALRSQSIVATLQLLLDATTDIINSFDVFF